MKPVAIKRKVSEGETAEATVDTAIEDALEGIAESSRFGEELDTAYEKLEKAEKVTDILEAAKELTTLGNIDTLVSLLKHKIDVAPTAHSELAMAAVIGEAPTVASATYI